VRLDINQGEEGIKPLQACEGSFWGSENRNLSIIKRLDQHTSAPAPSAKGAGGAERLSSERSQTNDASGREKRGE